MYITIKSIKKTLGKYIEYMDLYIGIPALFIFLFLFSFTNFKMLSLVYLTTIVFLMLPINLSKKNRMYKVIFLTIFYLLKSRKYCYMKNSIKESDLN